MLTLYGADRAVAIGPHGVVAETGFTLPVEPRSHVVFYAGGDFLVGYSVTNLYPDQAFWTSAPGETFEPAEPHRMHACNSKYNGGFGYQFATPGGRHDGARIMRPGDRQGIGDRVFQMSDGARVWSLEGYRSGLQFWAEVDPVTGVRAEIGSPPDFFTEYPLPADKEIVNHLLFYARLPEGVASSPLGSAAGMTGFRVLRDHGEWTGYVLEGVDGRHATYVGSRGSADPWGVARFPEGGADLLMTFDSPVYGYDPAVLRAHDGASPLWEVRAEASHTGCPSPAFWHFLTPRDAAGSRALRGLDVARARELLTDAALPPGITDPVLADGVRDQIERAARLVRERERISRRVATIRSGALITPPATAPDSDLLPALLGLLDYPRDLHPSVLPATITALAADGRYLAGDIDETLRRMSPPAAPIDWTPLLGHIDAVAWRAINGRTPENHRVALIALLRTWAAQPFARAGEWRLGECPDTEPVAARTLLVGGRFLQPTTVAPPANAVGVRSLVLTHEDATRIEQLLDLLSCNGTRIPSERAVRLFAERTGVREPIARLVLDGLPRRCHFGGGYSYMYDAHEKMLRTKPYQAKGDLARQYEQWSGQLDWNGRHRLLAAGMPEDPAELWSEDGDLAAAERMAVVWNELIGRRVHIPEDLTAELEATTGLTAMLPLALAHPEATDLATRDLQCRLLGNSHDYLEIRCERSNIPFWRRWNPYRGLATALAWALSERPVGDPAVRGVTELYERLAARLRAPELLVQLNGMRFPAELFGPGTYAGAPLSRVVYDDGLVVVDAHEWRRSTFLRPAALSDPEALAHSLNTCTDHGLTELAHAIRCEQTLVAGLSDLIDRAATTPVAAGHYEADPRHSVPDLVERVSASIGASPDAATLYLQLLTLARPTDRNLRRWNGWTPARHKKARAELAGMRLVVEEQRARAGRTAFVPGPWTEKLTKPHLPMETAKLASYLVRPDDKDIIGPYGVILPPRPLHEMFADAWALRNT